jgi:ribosomal protein S10
MNFGTVLDELSPEDHASLDRLTNFFQHASERFAEIVAAPRPLPT